MADDIRGDIVVNQRAVVDFGSSRQISTATATALSGSISVGVGLGKTVWRKAGAGGVVGKARQDDGEAGLAKDLQDATDAVVDFQRPSGGGDSGGGASELDHEAFGG